MCCLLLSKFSFSPCYWPSSHIAIDSAITFWLVSSPPGFYFSSSFPSGPKATVEKGKELGLKACQLPNTNTSLSSTHITKLFLIYKVIAEAEAPILWPPDVTKWLIRKDHDAGKDWRQEKGMIEDEMVGWHLWLNGHEFDLALGVSDGQGSLACCSPWGCKESDITQCLNWTEFTGYKVEYWIISIVSLSSCS